MAGTASSLLQNEITVTLQAQQKFLDTVSQLTTIASGVLESQQQLTTNAMVTTAGQRFGGVVLQWAEDFEDLRSTLNWMAQQLGDTAQQLQAGNQNAADMAAALPAFGSSGFISPPS
jgi:hypothetical protein